MAEFPANPSRKDPYKNFKFRIKWDGAYVAGINKISALRKSTQPISFREGGDPSSARVSPGQTTFEPIVLERGMTQDTNFEAWCNKVWNFGAKLGMESSLADFRKDVIIDFYNEAGQLAISYKIYRCWPSEYQALPDLDSMGNDVAIQMLRLENEGWERDTNLQPPKEPSFNAP